MLVRTMPGNPGQAATLQELEESEVVLDGEEVVTVEIDVDGDS